MKRTIVAVSAAFAALLTTPTTAEAAPLEACQFEDGPGPCVWDGRHMGNGEGASFRINRKGDVIYISHRKAHRLLSYGR